jgi:hypothetical protein
MTIERLGMHAGTAAPLLGDAHWQHIRIRLESESMAELSLTQTSEQSTKIFVDTGGYPLPVYLDVNPEIPTRPRLIRLLRVSAIMLWMCSID